MDLFIALLLAVSIAACWDSTAINEQDDTETGSDTARETGSETETTSLDCSLGTYEGDAALRSDSDLASLMGYVAIEGSLTVSGDISTLSGLGCLEEIGGGFIVHETALLEETSGLSGLRTVLGRIEFIENSRLAHLSLPALEHIGSWVSIYYNPSLISVEVNRLASMGDIYPYISISDNAALEAIRLNGFVSMNSMYMIEVYMSPSLEVFEMNNLVALDGRLLIEVGGTSTSAEPTLETVDLGRLEVVRGLLTMQGLASESLDGLAALTAIDGRLFIFECPALTDISLPALTSFSGGLGIQDAPALESIGSLGGLTEIGSLGVNNSPALRDLGGLSDLVSASGIHLERLSALGSLTVLNRLAAVSGSLSIVHLDALTSIALPELDSVGQDMTVAENPNLEHLDIDALTEVGGDLEIRDNPALSCDADAWEAAISVGGEFIVAENGDGCE